MGNSGKGDHSILGVPDHLTDSLNLPASGGAFVSLGLKSRNQSQNGSVSSFNGTGSPDVSRQVHNLTHSSGNKNYSHWPDVGNSRVVCKTFRKCYVNTFLEFKQVS